jgi:hypothetical protein
MSAIEPVGLQRTLCKLGNVNYRILERLPKPGHEGASASPLMSKGYLEKRNSYAEGAARGSTADFHDMVLCRSIGSGASANCKSSFRVLVLTLDLRTVTPRITFTLPWSFGPKVFSPRRASAEGQY